jgi:phospholipid/cholesterol/gamma-HCH transport system ATP-binding protein
MSNQSHNMVQTSSAENHQPASPNDNHLPQEVIRLDNLVTHYGHRKILDDINLSVHKGEIMVIMGGSGSGKTTLLQHLLGLVRPTSGCISILGHDITRISDMEMHDLRKDMGVAFQGGALFSSMTVGENIQLPLREHTRLDNNTIHIMTRLKLELVNLSGFENLMPSELSGGMIKRVALARAVIMDPKLLFFDEPSAGLDPVVSAELDELILRLKQAMNMTIVVVTHELESAFKIADRITILDNGKILMTGTVDEIRNCKSDRIQNLLNRRPRNEPVNADEYMQRLTGQ